MKLNPYLSFNGQCEEAFRFYEKCLGGRVVFMKTYRDSPMAEQTPPGWAGKIMHATFAFGDQILSGADPHPNQYKKPQGFSIMLNLADAAEAGRIFEAFSEKAEVQMDLQETFWALRFGALVDQFGIPWLINCEKPA